MAILPGWGIPPTSSPPWQVIRPEDGRTAAPSSPAAASPATSGAPSAPASPNPAPVAATSDDNGSSPGVPITIGVVAVLAAVAGGALWWRRRTSGT
ncbi:hypothetical protein [Kitasatospora sp. NPDC050467]|uniref:hypothetical protein n=1 Tax=unclassified Kitasatospora TaxID=2633591 RepID=UPI0032553720